MTRFLTDRTLFLRVARLGALGKAPLAPGTVATVLAGIPSAYFLKSLGEPLSFLLLAILLVLSCTCAEVAEVEIGRSDPGEVVIDELVGFLITMFGFTLTLESLVLGIASFRLLDIWKPWPISLLHERFKGGVAIVMDDVAAGVVAHLIVWVGLKAW